MRSVHCSPYEPTVQDMSRAIGRPYSSEPAVGQVGRTGLTAAIPMENPYCSCKLQPQSLWRIPTAAVSHDGSPADPPNPATRLMYWAWIREEPLSYSHSLTAAEWILQRDCSCKP